MTVPARQGDLLADGGSCTMVNTLRTGTFTVFKTYDDGNETPVTVLASCTGEGDFVENPLPAAPGDPAVFTYTGFIGDPTCTAVESDVPPVTRRITRIAWTMTRWMAVAPLKTWWRP